MNNLPCYRATKNNTSVGGKTYQRGEEFDYEEWPRCLSGACEPINDSAKRIMHLWKTRERRDDIPLTTWDFELGRPFVPHYVPSDFRHGRKPALPDKELPGMPRYRVVWPGTFGDREVQEDEIVAWCGWPIEELAPANDEARRVVDYFNTYRDHGKLLPAPWDDMMNELVLPEFFTAAQKQKRARDNERSASNGGSYFFDQIKIPLLNEPPVVSVRKSRGGGRRRVA